MSDLLVVWDVPNSRGDWALNAAGNDLAMGPTLDACVYLSLFTDRRAAADDEIPDGTTNRRGHWTDTGAQFPIGSKLWLLQRAKATPQTLNLARGAIADALQWMIADGLVAAVDVLTEWTKPNMLGALVTLYRRDGTKLPLRYDWAWGELA